MPKKTILLLFLLISLIIIFSCTRKEVQPNILLILADDMGYGDPACYNPESRILTPNIDNLASNGIRFLNAHSSAAWCTPSRYGLLTGRYPMRKDIGLAGRECLIEPSQINLASMLKSQGYYTACIGKWHLGFDTIDYEKGIRGGPVDRGFDYYFGIPVSLDIPPYYYIENDHCVEAPTIPIEASSSPEVSVVQGEFWRKGLIAPGFKHQEVLPMLTEKVIEVIEKHQAKNAEIPFFLYFPLPAPHTPWLPTDEFVGKSQAGMYGDFVMQVDYTIGQILKTLDALKITNNTMVIFSSDNGPVWFDEDIARHNHRSSYYLKGIKSDMWEGGHRVPFIVQWPHQIKKNSSSSELIGFTDVLATLAELCKSKLDFGSLDSESFLPVLLSQQFESPIREELIVDNKAIITQEWKLILGHGGDGFNRAYSPSRERFLSLPLNEGELYNIREDSTESNNIYKDNPDQVETLKKRFETIKQASDNQMNSASNY
jgi:arylsulfatase A